MIKKYIEYINEKLDMTNKISISEVEDLIKKIFSNDKISYSKSIYEYDEEKDLYKLIIIINNLFYNKTNIFYTKLIFFVNKEKSFLEKNELSYLYEINCNFKHIKFNSIEELENLIKNIFSNRKFGDDIKYISDFLVSPASLINEWLIQNNINYFSIYNVEFNPDVKIIPCKSLYFMLNINVDNKNLIQLKISKKDIDKEIKYIFEFNINDVIITSENNSIKSITQIIGNVLKNNIKE